MNSLIALPTALTVKSTSGEFNTAAYTHTSMRVICLHTIGIINLVSFHDAVLKIMRATLRSDLKKLNVEESIINGSLIMTLLQTLFTDCLVSHQLQQQTMSYRVWKCSLTTMFRITYLNAKIPLKQLPSGKKFQKKIGH